MEVQAAAEERAAPVHMEARAAAEESTAPLHMEAQAAAEERETPLRTHSFLFGCVLKGAKTKVSFPGGGDDLREQLTLRTASLGPGAPDVLHVLAVIGETQEGSLVRVPVATLRPSLLTCVHLGGLELTPPVTFWLVAGTGPLYISGQHLVALTESDAAACRAAAKREAAAARESAEREAAAGKASAEGLAAAKASAEREAEQTQGRLLVKPERVALPPSQSNDGTGSSSKEEKPSENLTVEQIKEKLVSLTWDRIPQTIDKFRRFAHFILCTDEPRIVQQLWEFVLSEKLNEPPQNTSLTLEQWKEKLVSLSKQQGGRIPKTMDKFNKFACFCLGMADPRIVQQLWEFVLSEKLNGPPQKPSLTLEQWKEKLVSLSKHGGRIPRTMDKFQKFVCNSSDMDDPQIVQQLWEFVLSKKLFRAPGIMHGARSLHNPQLTVEQMKEKLVSVCLLEPGRIPKTFEEFLKLAYFTLDTDEPRIMQQMWEFMLSEGRLMIAARRLREEPDTAQAAVVRMSSAVNGPCIFNKLVCNAAVQKSSQKDFLALPTSQSNHFGSPPSTGQNPPMTVEQMKEELVCLALERGRIPESFGKFRQFVHSTFHTDEPWIVNHLWRFTREKVKEAGTVSSWAND